MAASGVPKQQKISRWAVAGERYSQEKAVYYSVQYKNGCLAASDLFHMFTQSIKFYTFPYHVSTVQMFEKGDSSNRQ